MNRGLYPLLTAQFVSAFADNAILFTVIAMVLQTTQLADWYVPALQSTFLVAFVMLAPWVGPFSDQRSKPRVLIIANLIKAAGALLILSGIEPLLSYAVVGMGAAIYSPAKYGILPEISGHDQLVKANSWMEASTILAIVLGTVIGAKIADASVTLALQITIALYLGSVGVTLLIPRLPPRGAEPGPALVQFKHKMEVFFQTPPARFSMLGSSLFWAAAATLRVVIVAWAPQVLHTSNASDIAELTLFLALGIVAGSAVVPYVIPIEHLRRARMAAYGMAGMILILSLMESVWPARLVMFCIGAAGGMFVVPINATLQDIGHHSIGSGGAVAIQNFFANVAMLLAVGTYTLASARGANPIVALAVLGTVIFVCTFLVSWHLPKNSIGRGSPASQKTTDQ